MWKGENAQWYVNSICSCHVTRTRLLLSSFQPTKDATISFGNKCTGKIIGKYDTYLSELIKILDISLVEDLRYTLLSVSQLCDQGNNVVIFTTRYCKIVSQDKVVLLKGKRNGSTYLFDLEFKPSSHLCISSLSKKSTLWHQRMGNSSLHLLHKLEKKGLVRGLPKIKP